MNIDWRRVAEPQEDGYDVEVTKNMWVISHYAHAVQRPINPDAGLVWPEGKARWVRLEDNIAPDSVMKNLAPTAAGVRQGLALLDTWPGVRRACAELLVGICPLTLGTEGGGHGCCCGNFGDDWGWIYVSADSPSGFAEGVVHEMGHWKLRALGVQFESWNNLLLDHRPEDLYVSPVRKDIARPMGAVLHAQYSYIHVAKMCISILKATPNPTKDDFDWTTLQLRRITEGQETLREHAQGTPGAGIQFLAGLDDWTTRVLTEGWEAVRQ